MSEDMLTDLAAQQAQTAQDLRSLAGDLAEIGGEVRTVSERSIRLERALAVLSSRIEQVAEQLEAEEDETPDTAPIAWHALDSVAAAEAWEGLLTWADEVLCPTYEITRGQLPDCWTRHPAMRNEVSWLRTSHAQAYLSTAHAGGAAEWHLRYLPGALSRIAGHAQGWGQSDETPRSCLKGTCRLGPLPQPWERRSSGFEPSRREVWDLAAVKQDIENRPEPES